MGAIWSSITNSITALLISRAIQGLGIGAANVLCRAILRDLYIGKELAKKVSYFGIIWVTSLLIAPIIGGYFEQYFSWRMNFIFLALFVAAFLIWALLKLPETKDPSKQHAIHPKEIAKSYWTIIKNQLCMGYILTASIIFAMFSAFYVTGPFLLQNLLGMTPISFGWTMLSIFTGYFLGSLINTRLIHRFSSKRAICIGLITSSLASMTMLILALLGFMNIGVIVLPLSLFFLGMGLIFTNSISGSLSSFPNLVGHTSALWGCFTYAGGMLATVVIALFEERNQIPLALTLFIGSILIVVVLTTMVFRKPNSAVESHFEKIK